MSLHRLNTICPYYTMYPLQFPLRVLRDAQPKKWVLDPFCGRGTTNFAARLLGMNTVGFDTSPIAVAIASAKLLAHTFLPLARHRADRPDETYLVDSSSDPWHAFPILIDDETFFDFVQNREAQPSQFKSTKLVPLTHR